MKSDLGSKTDVITSRSQSMIKEWFESNEALQKTEKKNFNFPQRSVTIENIIYFLTLPAH